MKENVIRVQTAKIFRTNVIIDKWHDVNMRLLESEKPYCSGKGV